MDVSWTQTFVACWQHACPPCSDLPAQAPEEELVPFSSSRRPLSATHPPRLTHRFACLVPCGPVRVEYPRPPRPPRALGHWHESRTQTTSGQPPLRPRPRKITRRPCSSTARSPRSRPPQNGAFTREMPRRTAWLPPLSHTSTHYTHPTLLAFPPLRLPFTTTPSLRETRERSKKQYPERGSQVAGAVMSHNPATGKAIILGGMASTTACCTGKDHVKLTIGTGLPDW